MRVHWTLRLVLAPVAMLAMLAGCEQGASPVADNDFAVLAQADERFEQAIPGNPLVFPQDHGAHPGYRIEWWYVTANLKDRQGRDWGIQWTLFRTAISPPETTTEASDTNPWQSGQVYLAHFAVSAPHEHRAFQRYARGGNYNGSRQAGVNAQPFSALLDDWELTSTGSEWLPLRLQAAQADVAADLVLSSDLPLVLQGEAGFSQKHPDGGGSYYYSHPFLQVQGELAFENERVTVTGEAWLDREWSSQFLQGDQEGWDWFALHLDDGSKVVMFQLRSHTGSPFTHAARFWPDGRYIRAAGDEIQIVAESKRTVAGRQLPLGWRLDWPAENLGLHVRAALDEQWMNLDFPYWEGRVEVRDNSDQPVGRGYLEMTGYAVTDEN